MEMDYCWSTLPEELKVEIFARLPVKSLTRFKCLNKTWRDLISSSNFATLHFDRNKNKAASHLCESTTHIRSLINNKGTNLHLPFINSSNSFGSLIGSTVGSSSNGLVCIRLWYVSSLAFVVWNPATREFRYLPEPETRRIWNGNSCAGFDFRPGGVCDYTVVLVKFHIGDRYLELNIEVQLFTRSTNSWKKIEDGVVPHMGVCHFDGVAVNGSMYWPALETGVNGTILSQFVACFDMWEEKFTRITGPCCADNRRYTKRLGVVKGSLAMFLGGDSADCFDGWVMNSQDQSWTKLFSIGPLSPTLPPEDVRVVVGLWLNGEIVIDIFNSDKVYLYDLSTKQLKHIRQGYYLLQYNEALFSI